jgi:hypothetical protein
VIKLTAFTSFMLLKWSDISCPVVIANDFFDNFGGFGGALL